ncbi:MAG: gliding motility-associated-like protein, partial [Saprospiraceae bacterium]
EGCQYKAEAIYNVIEPAFDTPNAFTPNGDNTSDYFNVLHGANVEIIEFKIFARWGEMIYNNETPTTGWDGKNKDKDMPSDVYFYFVRGRNPAGVILERKGDVTLIR